MGNGYFILSRNIFDSAIWRDDPHILKLFIYFIGQARHSKTPIKYPKVTINRGELVTSLSQIAEDNEYIFNNGIRKWSRAKVSRMIEMLIKQEYIKIASNTYGTHIKILNYDTYQTQNNYASDNYETAMKQPCNSYETATRINKKDKNDKKDKNGKKEDIYMRKQKFIKPTLSEWIDFSYEYAKGYFDFPISKMKVKALLTNSYEHWERENWKKVKSWKRTAQNKIRKENTKLKDWDTINNQSGENFSSTGN